MTARKVLTRDRWVGTCYLCHEGVKARDAERVTDVAVSGALSRTVRRLAHAGACASTLRGRIGGR